MSRLGLLMNGMVVQERRRHVSHHAFTQRLCSNPLFVPHYVIEPQPSHLTRNCRPWPWTCSSMILSMKYSTSLSEVTTGPGHASVRDGKRRGSFAMKGRSRDEWIVWWILVALGRRRVYVEDSRYACVISNGPSNLGMNLATWPSFACMYSHCRWAVARRTQSPTWKVGSGERSLLVWCAWLILAAVRESFASRRASASCLTISYAVSSPLEVGVGRLLPVGFVGSSTFSGLRRGGIRRGECADLSMKGKNLVDALTVFIILK
jgi:hypothetical protein